jgi:hypothetical protein
VFNLVHVIIFLLDSFYIFYYVPIDVYKLEKEKKSEIFFIFLLRFSKTFGLNEKAKFLALYFLLAFLQASKVFH